MSAIVISAVASVSTSGVFDTTIPRRSHSVEVDVVEADGVVRDDAELRTGGIEQLRVHAVGQHRHEAVAARRARKKLRARRRQLLVVDVEPERPLELLPHPRRHAAGDEDARPHAACWTRSSGRSRAAG